MLPGAGKIEEMLPPEEIYIGFHKEQPLETQRGSCSGTCVAGTTEVPRGTSSALSVRQPRETWYPEAQAEDAGGRSLLKIQTIKAVQASCANSLILHVRELPLG